MTDATTIEQKQSAAPPRSRMVRATVARGRTVVVPDPDSKIEVIGYSERGEPVSGLATTEYGPGEEVLITEREAKRLRELGYLVDPNAKAPEPAEGGSVREVA